MPEVLWWIELLLLTAVVAVAVAILLFFWILNRMD